MGRLNRQAKNVLKLSPGPIAAGDPGLPYRNNFVATGSEAFDSNQWDTRWDYYINDKSSVFGPYSYASFNNLAPRAFRLLARGAHLAKIPFFRTTHHLLHKIRLGDKLTF